MKAKELLAAAADIFAEDPGRWSQGAFARNARGASVDALAPDARSFSMNGFIERSLGEGLVDAEEAARCYQLLCDAIFVRFHHRFIVPVNDQSDVDVVISVLREAAK